MGARAKSSINPPRSDNLHPVIDQIFKKTWPTNGREDERWRKRCHSLPISVEQESTGPI